MPQRIHTNFSRSGNVCDGDMGMVHGMVFIAEEKFASEAKDTSSSLKQSPFLLFFFSVHVREFITLRSKDDYPKEDMDSHICCYLPSYLD